MADSVVNVSGYDTSYGIDAVQVGNDYRQVLCVGDFSNSGLDGSLATVDGSSLQVKDVNFGASAGLSYYSTSLSADGSSPFSDTVLVAAPGEGSKICLWGFLIVATGSSSTTQAFVRLTRGTDIGTNWIFNGMAAYKATQVFSRDFKHPIILDENTALMATSDEVSGQVYLDINVYYTII